MGQVRGTYPIYAPILPSKVVFLVNSFCKFNKKNGKLYLYCADILFTLPGYDLRSGVDVYRDC